jgi:hypothetical protein
MNEKNLCAIEKRENTVEIFLFFLWLTEKREFLSKRATALCYVRNEKTYDLHMFFSYWPCWCVFVLQNFSNFSIHLPMKCTQSQTRAAIFRKISADGFWKPALMIDSKRAATSGLQQL